MIDRDCDHADAAGHYTAPYAIPKLDIPPPVQGPQRFNWVPLKPTKRGRTSPAWYLVWPAPSIGAAWFCIPATVEEATEFRPRRVGGASCGAPPGVRCRCGAQREGHDPGDEQL